MASLPARWPTWVSQLSPFRLFVAVGLVGMFIIGVGSVVASQRAGESEAMLDVRFLTQIVAKTVVEPNLSPALLAGEAQAIEELDRIVRSRVLDATTVRVKLWDSSGRIVFSDEPLLIGEVYELEGEKAESLWSGEVVSEISSLEGPENRFEVDAGQLLEVYLPIEGPDGKPLLYESYFSLSKVTDSASRIRTEFVPIIVAGLVLMEGMHLGLAWRLNATMRRNQLDRERLLQRAIESSNLERRRIAGDLHDGVVQDLVGTSFAVAAAAEAVDANQPELSGSLKTAAAGTRRSLQSLRSLLVDIYPPNLREQGLESALVDLLAPASGLGIETDLTIIGDVDADPDAVTLAYRVLQEAVRNVLRHAEATKLDIEVALSPDALVATVRDDGRGFVVAESTSNGHLGLRLLADLTAEAGAGFSVDSSPGVGTMLHLQVPR